MMEEKNRLSQEQNIAQYLSSVDPILGEVIKRITLEERAPQENHFYALVSEIIGQQLSGKAADAIEKRFLALFDSRLPKPKEILALSDETIRTAGLSFSKISYIKNIAKADIDFKRSGKQGSARRAGSYFDSFSELGDEEIISALIKIKGVGRWTAEMFLMFTLARPDVFSYGDLGLRKAMVGLYKLKKEPTLKKATQISNKWKPYRTLACRYLWASSDNRP